MSSLDVTIDGRSLPAIARAALLEHFGRVHPPIAVPEELRAPGAAFVTLTERGRLRGCVGSTEAAEPLVASVRRSAVSAAVRDRRFPTLRSDELDDVAIAVSVLSHLEPIPADQRRDVERSIVPGLDGLVVRSGSRSATFLPQVWRDLPETGDFLDALLHKAGLEAGSWPTDLAAWKYRARTWRER